MEQQSTSNGHVIVIGNQKGGVGKTTTCVHLAAALGELGKRVLIIDLDPTAGSTKHLGIEPNQFAGTFELMTAREAWHDLVIGEDLPRGVHLIPARTDLCELDVQLSRFADRTTLLQQPINQARSTYDFILLDTQPSAAATTTVSAYCVADWFLITTMPHPLAIGGLKEALRDWQDVRTSRNPDFGLLGILLTAVDLRSKLGSDIRELLDTELENMVFETWVTATAKLPQVSGIGKTLFDLDETRHHKVTEQFRKLASEVLERVSQGRKQNAEQLGERVPNQKVIGGY